MATSVKIDRVKKLGQLRRLLTQDESGLKKYVYPKLAVGDVWWIPDQFSGFGGKQRHPWVIVRGYSEQRANVIACPRTTGIGNSRRGIVTPAGVLPELDHIGLILLKHRHPFVAKDFRSFRYVGRLPENWVQKILDFYKLSRGKQAVI